MKLSSRQEQTVAVALTTFAAVFILLVVLGMFWLVAVFLRTFSHVFLPLAVAGIAALVCQPYYEWLHERLRLPVPLAIVAIFLSVLVPIGLFFGFFGSVFIRELRDFFIQLPIWWEQLLAEIELHLPELKTFLTENRFGKKLAQSLEGLGPMLAVGLEHLAASSMQAGTGVVGWTGRALSWFVAPVYFVFFLIAPRKDVSQLSNHLPFLKEDTRNDVVYLVQEFVNIMVAFFRGQIIIAFLQGIFLAIGFKLIGLNYGIVLGLLLGFLNIIPYLGSMVGLSITIPLAYFQEGGGIEKVVGVLVVLGVVQLIEGYLLTPRIMGDRTGLHPMAIIFAVFFWGAALGGILGMILAIPLTAFLVVFWRLAKEKYIAELI